MTPASSVLLFLLTLAAAVSRNRHHSRLQTPRNASNTRNADTCARAGDYEPSVGQPGKDVVWVPTSLGAGREDARHGAGDEGGPGDGPRLRRRAQHHRGGQARRARDWRRIQPGHGRACRGAPPSRRASADRATFVEGDMFEADISKASVLALFLLTDNLRRLLPKFLDMRPGSRIVVNTFTIPDWEPDAKETLGGECMSWCTALLWIVPAKVEGMWRMSTGEPRLETEVPGRIGHVVGEGPGVSDRERPAPRRRVELHGEWRGLHRTCQRQCDRGPDRIRRLARLAHRRWSRPRTREMRAIVLGACRRAPACYPGFTVAQGLQRRQTKAH